MSSAESTRRSEILRAEESIRQLAGEIGRFQESRNDLLRVEESLQAAMEAVKVATETVDATRGQFDRRMDVHESRVQDLTQEVEKRFQLSAERFDASIDTLISVRRRIEEEADRLHSVRGEISELLQAHESRIEARFLQLEEKITEVLDASEQTRQQLDQQSQQIIERQKSLDKQLNEQQTQLQGTFESSRTETKEQFVALGIELSRLSSRLNYALGALGTIALIVVIIIVLLSLGA